MEANASDRSEKSPAGRGKARAKRSKATIPAPTKTPVSVSHHHGLSIAKAATRGTGAGEEAMAGGGIQGSGSPSAGHVASTQPQEWIGRIAAADAGAAMGTLRPGTATTEFWLTVALISLSVLSGLSGFVPPEHALAFAAFTGTLYKALRIALKAWQGHLDLQATLAEFGEASARKPAAGSAVP